MPRDKIISTPILVILFFILFVSVYVLLKVFVYAPSDNLLTYKNNTLNVMSLQIPDDLEFCGEKIPSDNIRVKKAIEQEFYSDSYWKLFSALLFRKTQRWFPVIEPILKSEGVPNDFKYVAVIESHLTNAVSPAGAAGFWQLGESTAYLHGLEVNDFIDERFHVEKATRAACKHIKDAYSYFKNWTLTAAAYNCGINGILVAMKIQRKKNYYDLVLNPETGSFVYRILAYKTLLSNPAHFGIEKKKTSRVSLTFRIVKVDTSISNLTHFARHVKSSAKEIMQFNPWMLRGIIVNPERKKYDIRIPKKISEDYNEYLTDISNARASDSFNEVAGSPEILNADTTLSRQKKIIYEVKVSESLKTLAGFFNVKEGDLRKWNNLENEIEAIKGQTLVIYK